MRRARPRPRRGKQTAKSRLAPCVYSPDWTLPDPQCAEHPLCVCGLAWRHPRHELLDVHDEQAAHRARIGDDQ